MKICICPKQGGWRYDPIKHTNSLYRLDAVIALALSTIQSRKSLTTSVQSNSEDQTQKKRKADMGSLPGRGEGWEKSYVLLWFDINTAVWIKASDWLKQNRMMVRLRSSCTIRLTEGCLSYVRLIGPTDQSISVRWLVVLCMWCVTPAFSARLGPWDMQMAGGHFARVYNSVFVAQRDVTWGCGTED